MNIIEKRYSLRTAGQILGLTAMAIRNRAIRLEIDTTNGLTAQDVKVIKEYKGNPKYATKCSAEDLMRELEELG